MAEKKLEYFGKRIGEVEFRASDKGVGNTVGYASIFDAEYEDDWMIEVVRRGAFTRALNEKQDVRSLIDHIPTLIVGRTKSGTLRLAEDDKGLYTETELPDTTYAADLRAKMKRGDVDGMSFGFIVQNQKFGTRNGKLYREILDVDLFDVSVVTFPAYDATSVQLRSREQIVKEREEILKIGKETLEKTGGLSSEARAHFDRCEKYLAAIESL